MDTTVVAATLIVYKLVLVVLGLWAQRRTSDAADFFLGGRRLGGVVSSLSYAASAASAWTLLGFSGATFALGVSAIWIVVGLCIAVAFNWWWVAPRMMRHSAERNLLTVPDFVTDSIDGPAPGIGQVSALIIVTTFLLYVASQFQGAGQTFTAAFHMNPTGAVVLGGALVLFYTLLGGFWAVSVTDTLQGILMIGAAVLLPTAAIEALGGWSVFAAGLGANLTPEQLHLTAGNAGLVAVGIVVGFAAAGLGMFGQPHLIARLMATRDMAAIRTARVMAVLWYVVVFVGIYIAGLAGRLLVSELQDPEALFFVLSELLFHPIVASILIAAVLSAIMSTADSMLLVSAASIAHDMGLNRRFPGRELLISRIVIAVLAAIAVAISLTMPASIFRRVLFAWTAIGSAFGPLVIMRLTGLRFRPVGIWLAILGGFGSAIVLYLLPDSPGQWAERVLPFALSLAVLLLNRRSARD